jgi:pullulanase
LQHPVVAFIDESFLVRLTITQTDDILSFHPESFRLWDEFDKSLDITAVETEPLSLHVTGDFFNWQILPEGKMLWDKTEHQYYCELPLKKVKNKEFKFIENGFIWYPKKDNLKVNPNAGSFPENGYLLTGDKVRFILKNRMFEFQNLELILHTKQKLLPHRTYYLDYLSHNKIKLINRDIFDQPEYYYAPDDLGCRWSPKNTTFKIWSPVADNLKVLLYKKPTAETPDHLQEMDYTKYGVWQANIPGNWENFYYLYEITIDKKTYSQIDPYSRALSLNSKKSLVFDEKKSFPLKWQQQKDIHLNSPLDAVIYELHIRDFSISPLWQGPPELRGKYLGLTWSGNLKSKEKNVSIGLQHLTDLGVNVIQLLPVFDFNTVDESGTNPAKIRNWGYDPCAYNVPEGSYSLHPEDSRRLLEFRQMIMSLHNQGFMVVMDVVYNHTADVGAPFSVFDTFMPEFFYRMDNAGHYTNGSGCGNEIATEKPMVRKYILESLLYWLTEFKIDGFRFDLMGLIDITTMKQITDNLRKIKKDVLIYGEPWAGGASPLKNPTLMGTQKNLGFAVFNDHFRDALRGDTDGTAKGWVMGADHLKDKVISGLMGSIDDFSANPSETINYVSAHDNYTLYDKLKLTLPETDEKQILKRARLALAIIITSQGIPFLHAGCEFLRSKRTKSAPENEIKNSYKADDDINQLDWQRKITYYDLFDYLKKLITLRKLYPALRIENPNLIKKRIRPLKKGINTKIIALFIDGLNNETDLIVFYNPLNKKIECKLPEGIWRIIFDDKHHPHNIEAEHIDTNIILSPISTTILELD